MVRDEHRYVIDLVNNRISRDLNENWWYNLGPVQHIRILKPPVQEIPQVQTYLVWFMNIAGIWISKTVILIQNYSSDINILVLAKCLVQRYW